MKLIHKATGLEVREGDIIRTKDSWVTIHSCPQPHKPSSEGKMQVRYSHGDLSTFLYCSCFDCEWIDREDRETQPVSDTTQAIHSFAQPTPVGGFVPSLPSVSSFDRTKELMAEVEEQFEQIRKTLNEIKTLLS